MSWFEMIFIDLLPPFFQAICAVRDENESNRISHPIVVCYKQKLAPKMKSKLCDMPCQFCEIVHDLEITGSVPQRF